MNTIGSRIKYVRGEETQASFAARTGISKGSLGGYERNENSPSADAILKICSTTGISVEWLMTGKGCARANEGLPSRPELFVDAKRCNCDVDLIMIPRVTARLSAGTGSLETDNDVKGMYAFRADWILRKGNTKNMVLMDVIGDSMSPEIKHGDIVLIDQDKKQLYGYGFYAVGLGEEVYIKQILSTQKELILHSINQQYKDIIINRSEENPDDLRIIGRVIWVGREIA